MDAKKVSISVGQRELAAARRVATRDGLPLSAVFMRGLARELEAEERRMALEELGRELPRVSEKRKRESRAQWSRKKTAAGECASCSTRAP